MFKKLLSLFKKTPTANKALKLNLVSAKDLDKYRKPRLTPIQCKRLYNMLHATIVSSSVNTSDELSKFLFAKCMQSSGRHDTTAVIATADYLLSCIWFSDGSFQCTNKELTATYLKFRGIPK